MVTFSKSFIDKRYTGNEFNKSSVLNDGVSLEQLNEKVSKKLEKKARRMRQQKILNTFLLSWLKIIVYILNGVFFTKNKKVLYEVYLQKNRRVGCRSAFSKSWYNFLNNNFIKIKKYNRD